MTESSLFGVSRQSFLYESNFGINCRYNYRIYSNTTHRSIYRFRNNSSYCYYFLHNILYTREAYCKKYTQDRKKKVSHKWHIPIYFSINDVYDCRIYWIVSIHGTLKYCFFIKYKHCFGIMIHQVFLMSYLTETMKFQLPRKISGL